MNGGMCRIADHRDLIDLELYSARRAGNSSMKLVKAYVRVYDGRVCCGYGGLCTTGKNLASNL